MNAATPQTEDRIEAALAADDVAAALQIARDYERRVPGPEAWSYMGRSLWRLGDLNSAEGFHRRSSGDGHPEGRLGLARAVAARGEFEEALGLAEPTLDIDSMTSRAAAFVGGVQWRLGRPAAAAETFERGASGADPVLAADLQAWAAAMRVTSEAEPGWRGAAGEANTRVDGGITWVEVAIAGRRATMRFDPLAWRSTITPELAHEVGGESPASALALPVEVAALRAVVPLRVADSAAGDGVLGFDVLAGLRWVWTPATGRVFLGVADVGEEEPLFQRDLARTHWIAARTIIDGLDAQLLVVPRIGARAFATALSLEGPNTVSLAAAQRSNGRDDFVIGETATLQTRVGGWSADLEYGVRHPCSAICQVPIATPVVLGPEFVNGWTWRWLPDDGQLAMIRND